MQAEQKISGRLFHGKIYSFCVLIFLMVFCISSCSSQKNLRHDQVKTLEELWDSLDVADQYHTGLLIYDPKKNKAIFDYRGDNFFTPASNIKLFTLFATLQYLDEFIPAAYYSVKGDTMTVWGGGDPGTKFPSIHEESSFVNFLTESDKAIVFSNQHFNTHRFGRGWSWDDFHYNFQPEKTAYPIYGNKLWIERFKDSIVLTPAYLNFVFKAKKDSFQKLTRNEWGTQYTYWYDHRKPYYLSSIPISLYENDIRSIWREATGKDITFKNTPFDKSAISIKGSNRDTLLKLMMHESENFIAEQLLLACAFQQLGSMDEKTFIERMLEESLADIQDSIVWVDGSGLSRYNLLTPRSTVWTLEKILNKKGLDYIKEIFPAGGKSGTIIDAHHSGEAEPYLYAKTGTMRNVYCISGILITRKGKVLLFSWMNNQFLNNPAELKRTMDKLFNHLRDHY